MEQDEIPTELPVTLISNPDDVDVVNDGTTISDKDREIIDFISDREIHYAETTKAQILNDLDIKYGEAGVTIYKDLNEMHPEDPDYHVDGECEECGKQAEEWIQQSQKSLKIIETFLDESLTDIAKSIINDESSMGSRISRKDIIQGIVNATGIKESKIKDKQILQVAYKIIFLGVSDGWLINDYFIDMNVEEKEHA